MYMCMHNMHMHMHVCMHMHVRMCMHMCTYGLLLWVYSTTP